MKVLGDKKDRAQAPIPSLMTGPALLQDFNRRSVADGLYKRAATEMVDDVGTTKPVMPLFVLSAGHHPVPGSQGHPPVPRPTMG